MATDKNLGSNSPTATGIIPTSTITPTTPLPGASDQGAPAGDETPKTPLGTGPGTGNNVKDKPLTQDDINKAVTDAIAPFKEQITKLTATQGTSAAQADAQKSIDQQNAQQLLQSTLSGYGVDVGTTGTSISNAILTMVQNNYDAPTIQALIEDPASANSADPNVKALATAWNTRFSGNVARIANGQAPLSPSEYIATEKSYQQIMQSAGLPSGFYDSPAQMGKLIGNDVAPTELQDRVNVAAKSIANNDPFYTSTLQSYYGLSSGDMIAHALDPNAALPLLQRQAAAATFGAAGARQGLAVGQGTANQYAILGVTQSQAEQGFQSIGQALPTEEKLAAIYGGANTQFGTAGQQQANLTAATFGGVGAAEAEQQLKKLQQQEVNAFSGSSGVDKNSLFGSTSGSF